MPVNWERRHEAFKAIHDKIAEVLARLHDVILQRKGTAYEINVSASGAVGPAVASGKKLIIYGYNFSVDADLKARLKWGSAGEIIASTRGTNAMNCIHLKEEGPEATQAYIQIVSGTGNVEGRLYAEVVNI